MDESKLLVLPGHSLNSHAAGTVLPLSVIEGGAPEAERLVAAGVLAWTEQAATALIPAARSAVLEMTDDELIAENARLRELLDAGNAPLVAERDLLAAEVAEMKANYVALAADNDNLKAERDLLAAEVERLNAEAAKKKK